MAVYKKRALAPNSETWDIDSYLKGQSVDALITKSVKLAQSLSKDFKKRLDNLENFYRYLVKSEELSLVCLSLGSYLQLACAEDTLSPLASKMAEFQMKLQPYQEIFATADAEELKHREKINKYLNDERLAKWRRQYEILFKRAEHILPENVAAYRAKISDAFADNQKIFTTLTDAELKYEHAIDKKGKKHEVSTQTISVLMRSEDRELRKNASLSYRKGSLLYKQTQAAMLSGQFLAEYRLAQSIKYQNQIFRSLDSDNVKPDLVLSLYSAAKKNMSAYKRVGRARRTFIAKKLKLTYAKVEPYDTEIELVGSKKTYTVQQAKSMVLDSVSLLGAEYAGHVRKAFESKWVDFHMTPNKMSGAFSAGIWGVDKKVILMNFSGDLQSISTLAHEMGHSMHSHYNHAFNDFQHGDYPAFIAEVASIFSELLLTEHVLDNEKDDAVKFKFLDEFISNFNGSVFRQLLLSEYEFKVVEAIEKGTPPTNYEALSKIFNDVSKTYILHDDWAKKYFEFNAINAINVPHYYLNFYVYKYAIGMIGALHMMNQIKKNKDVGVANYLRFVKSGNQNWPADILKTSGVDLYDPNSLKAAFDLYADYVDQYIALGKKLLKVTVKV